MKIPNLFDLHNEETVVTPEPTAEVEVSVNVPDYATKQLAIQHFDGGAKRKLVISTNWLRMFGFDEDAKYVEKSLGKGMGIVIELVDADSHKAKKVYTRTYKSRRNNPFWHKIETMLDLRSQSLLSEAIPANTEKVHIIFTHGKVYITPIDNKQAKRIEQVKSAEDALTAFAACSAGVDAYGLMEEGFTVQSVLEWRPPEKRDKTDLTETGALNFVANIPGVKHVFNEDINMIDMRRVAKAVEQSPNSLLSISLQCDDFSPLKTRSLKEAALEDLSTSSDMVYDMLRLVEEVNFPMVLLEQVKGFMTDPAGRIAETKLRRWGYEVHKAVLYSPEHGGDTKRERYYLFATSLPAPFEWPAATPVRTTPIWEQYIAPAIEQNRLRDVTDTKSMQDGLKCGRLRIIDRDSTASPTLLKSEMRQAKDSVVIQTDDGRLLFPDLKLMQDLMKIPETFTTNVNSMTIGSEIIGQSVDFVMHSRIIKSVKAHIESFKQSLKPQLAAA